MSLQVGIFALQLGVNLLQSRQNRRALNQQMAMAGYQAGLTRERAAQEAAFAIEGLQVGAQRSIVNAILSRQQAATAAAARTEFSGPLERAQISRDARFEERTRMGEFAQAVGAQRATFAASGAAGGRTKRLALARSQNEFARERLYRAQTTREALLVSTVQDRMAVLAADRAKSAAGFEKQAAIQDLERGVLSARMREMAIVQDAEFQAQQTRQQAILGYRQGQLNILGATLQAGATAATSAARGS